ncbi:UDP-N-acetylglucosamine transferase subunit [Pleosporales sp. CAS-2024a]
MAPPLSSLYTLSFGLAILCTLVVAATLRVLAILPNRRTNPPRWRKHPPATRLLVVLGSGGHTHEMFYLLRDLDTRRYTHRTYVVSSGDAFSAQRAVAFERSLEERVLQSKKETGDEVDEKKNVAVVPSVLVVNGHAKPPKNTWTKPHVGPSHYDIALIPRARRIHQSLLTTPFSALYTLYACIPVLLSARPIHVSHTTTPPHVRLTAAAAASAATDLPDLIITNGPATAVIVVLGSLLLRFFNVQGANSRAKCKTVYAESFARVKGLSLSGRLLSRVVDRFLVQWEELEGSGGGRAEYWGILV